MKFRVSDVQAERHEKIRSYLNADASIIAVCLAAIDLEWTIRRTIDAALGNESEEPRMISGLDRYKAEWNRICVKRRKMPSLDSVIGDWNKLLECYQIRHNIVHGRAGTTGAKYAETRVDAMLQAAVHVAQAGRAAECDPYKPLVRRNLSGPTRSPTRLK
jgi:hypothetical protein